MKLFARVAACFSHDPRQRPVQINLQEEWARALRYKKPLFRCCSGCDADPPFGFERRQRIDFTGEFERALSELRGHLEWLGSPEGILDTLQNQLSDALDELRANVIP